MDNIQQCCNTLYTMLSLLACVQTCLLYKKKLDLQSLLDLHNVPFELVNIRDLLMFCQDSVLSAVYGTTI